MSVSLDSLRAREKAFSPIGENRYLVRGRAYLALVDRGGLAFRLECVGCAASWVHQISWDDLANRYVIVPARPSPLTLHTRLEGVAKFVQRCAGHVCMPRGYTYLLTSLLGRVDPNAPRSEQLEALSVVVAELAAEARRGDL